MTAAGSHAIERGATKVDADFELRNADLLFHLQVDEARDLRKLFAEPFGDGSQRIEIVTEDFDRDLGAHSR